jgi:hypothetical protein
MPASNPQNKQLAYVYPRMSTQLKSGKCYGCFSYMNGSILQTTTTMMDNGEYLVEEIPKCSSTADVPIGHCANIKHRSSCIKSLNSSKLSNPKKSKPKVEKSTEQLGFNDYLKDKRLRGEV